MDSILTDSNLLVPFELQLYQQVMLDEKLNKDEKLKEALWQLSLMK